MSLSQTIRENRATIVCGIVVVALLAGLALWSWKSAGSSEDPLVALVHDGDDKVHEMPLDRDASLEVVTSLGSNTVEVRDGSIRMIDADCPNGNCLRQHELSSPGGQIICLPHQLWVEVVPKGTDGGEMDVSLVDADDDVDLVAR